MMKSVRARRDNDCIQETLQPHGKAPVTVRKKHFRLKGQLVNAEGPGRDSDNAHRKHTDQGRESDLAKVKTKRGRDIEIGIDVAQIVESPEKWHAMIRQIPVIENQVHEQEAEDELNENWQRDEMENQKFLQTFAGAGRMLSLSF